MHRGARVNTVPFECIRGFGALQVSIGHYYAFWSTKTYPGIEMGGGNAVLMFLIMSGFVMQVGYAKHGPADGSCCCCSSMPRRGGCCVGCGGHFARDFWSRRFSRLAPVVYLSILLYIPLGYHEQWPRFADLAMPLQAVAIGEDAAITATGLQTWVGSGLNGPL